CVQFDTGVLVADRNRFALDILDRLDPRSFDGDELDVLVVEVGHDRQRFDPLALERPLSIERLVDGVALSKGEFGSPVFDQSEILDRRPGRLDRGVGTEIIGEDLGHRGADLIVDAGRSSGCDRDEVSAFLTILAASATAAACGGEQCDRSDARGSSEETESSRGAHTAVLLWTLNATWQFVV